MSRRDQSAPFHVRETRYPELGFIKQSADLWRVVDRESSRGRDVPVCVGPLYKSRGELLADLERYARESWGLS